MTRIIDERIVEAFKDEGGSVSQCMKKYEDTSKEDKMQKWLVNFRSLKLD